MDAMHGTHVQHAHIAWMQRMTCTHSGMCTVTCAQWHNAQWHSGTAAQLGRHRCLLVTADQIVRQQFEFTSTEEQAADALTKILTVAERIKHFGRMGMKFNQFEG